MRLPEFELRMRTGEPPRGIRGHFLVWLRGSQSPIVLYRAQQSVDWRRGAQRVEVDAWAGPLPERASEDAWV